MRSAEVYGKEELQLSFPEGSAGGATPSLKDHRLDWLTMAEDERMSQRPGDRGNSSILRGVECWTLSLA